MASIGTLWSGLLSRGRWLLRALWRPKAHVVLIVALVIYAGTVGTGFAPLDNPAEDLVDEGQNVVDSAVAGAQDAATLNKTKLREELHAEINEVRTERGLSPLRQSSRLHDIALYHSQDMATNSYFAHTSPDSETLAQRYGRYGISCPGGENIWRSTDVAAANDESEMAVTIVDSWMDSPGHRENILNR